MYTLIRRTSPTTTASPAGQHPARRRGLRRARHGIGHGVSRVARAAVRNGSWGARDSGTTTAEYAIVTMAAVGFAGLLAAILRGGDVRGLLLAFVQRALDVA